MTLLTVLALIYAAVLVLALAAGLIMILIYLRRIVVALGETLALLKTASERTAGLSEPLTGVHDAVQESVTPFEQTAQSLQQAETALKQVTSDKAVVSGSRGS